MLSGTWYGKSLGPKGFPSCSLLIPCTLPAFSLWGGVRSPIPAKTSTVREQKYHRFAQLHSVDLWGKFKYYRNNGISEKLNFCGMHCYFLPPSLAWIPTDPVAPPVFPSLSLNWCSGGWLWASWGRVSRGAQHPKFGGPRTSPGASVGVLLHLKLDTCLHSSVSHGHYLSGLQKVLHTSLMLSL